MKHQRIYFLFIIISAIHLVLIQVESELAVFTKPLLIPSLLWYYYVVARNKIGIFILALFACWLGDCLLIFTGESPNFFLAGLGAFLIGHLLYIFSFRKLIKPSGESASGLVYLLFAIPLAFAAWLISTLWPDLGGFKWPVVIYTIVIATMFIHAARRLDQTSKKSFWVLMFGAFLFMVSDSLLAYNMFGSPIPLSGLLIMSTYLVAQWLIVKGVLAHEHA